MGADGVEILAVTQLGKCRASGHGLRTQADLECKDLVISRMGKRALSGWGKPSVCVEFNVFCLCKCDGCVKLM